MRKNGSRLISLRQYRLTDLFLFGVILVIYDALAYLALQKFMGALGLFMFTMTVPITVMVMMRWGWPSVFFAVADGALYNFFIGLLNGGASWKSYVCLCVGNAAMMLMLIPLKLIGKQKVAEKWYFSALFVIFAWILDVVGISAMEAAFGNYFVYCFLNNAGINPTGLLALTVGLLVIMVFRKFDGMFEDQKHYLLRLDKERRERLEADEFGLEPIEVDEETISILKKRDDDL